MNEIQKFYGGIVGEELNNLNKGVFGLNGKEEELASKEIESAEEHNTTNSYEDDMDFSGAGGPNDDR